MLDLMDPVLAYEAFKLQWMIDHGYTIPDLIKHLELMVDEDLNGSDMPTSLQNLFSDWEYGFGFDGSIWPCYQEFLENDYPIMLKSYMNTKGE